MMKLLLIFIVSIQSSLFAFDDVCELENGQRLRISREVIDSDRVNPENNLGAAENLELFKDLKLTSGATIPAGWYRPNETAYLDEGKCYAAQVMVAVTKDFESFLRVYCVSTNAFYFRTYSFPLKCGY